MILRKLGYSWSGKNPWAHLGFDKEEGSIPSLQAVEQRTNFADLLLSATVSQSWAALDLQTAREVRVQFQADLITCKSEILSGPTKKSKGEKQPAFGRFQEAGQDQYMIADGGRDCGVRVVGKSH